MDSNRRVKQIITSKWQESIIFLAILRWKYRERREN